MKRLVVQILRLLVFVALILPGPVMAETEAFADMDLQLSQDDVSLLMGGDLSFHFSKAERLPSTQK